MGLKKKECDEIDNPYADHTLSIMHDLFLLAKLGAAPRLSGFLRIRQQNSCFPFLEPMWKERLFFLTRDQGHDCLLYCKKRYGSLKKLNIDTSNQVVRIDAIEKSNFFCFQVTSDRSEEITLAAASEFQMQSWIACLNSQQ